MCDNRLDNLSVNEPTNSYTGAVKIDTIRLTNYKFFYGVFELPVNGKNLLLYGENGSGKSTIYKALELLTQKSFKDLDDDLNVFAESENVEVLFKFNTEQELILTSDLEKLPDLSELSDQKEFLKGLSIFKPMLDYKKLLKVHFSTDFGGDRINLFNMFRELFKDYPIKTDNGKKALSALDDLNEYFAQLKKILEDDFQADVNRYLNDYFTADFSIEIIEYKTKINPNTGVATPVINITLDYKENLVENYHSFLNEARLSALAISMYMVAIKKLLGSLENDCLKILVLDDLLISLDMSNRLKLLKILKSEFADFQIFFFTHSKELYEIFKGKMDWNKYELYLDNSGDIPMPILKQGKSEIERAKVFYAQGDYDACAVLLRKGFEGILKTYLTIQEQRDSNCYQLNLAGLISRAISVSSGEIKSILQNLNSERTYILNPLCHDGSTEIYSEELKSVMEGLEKLEGLRRN